MEDKLQNVLREYIINVENVCNILIKSINKTECLNLKGKYDFFDYLSKNKKYVLEAEGIQYLLHGVGCMAISENVFIDWDFGYRSRWCGIEPWKVASTLRHSKSTHAEYFDGSKIIEFCDRMVEKKVMFKKYGQYYFTIPENETFMPKFPTEYDMLVIEHSDFRWSVPRNKLIDKFIRKSRKIYNQIEKNEDKYLLRFFLKGKEVCVLPYDDIGYPDSAVKIMNDDILQNIYKEKQSIT